jgi:hypothetical protein
MTINSYMLGSLVRCKGDFDDADGDPQDPGTVTFVVKPPTGSTATYVYGVGAEVIKSGIGRYYVDVSANVAGRWHYRAAGTVTGIAADEHEFHVEPSAVDA